MTERLNYLRRQHATALLSAFLQDQRNALFHGIASSEPGFDHLLPPLYSDLSLEPSALATPEDRVFQAYRNADPTSTGACTQWLIRLALAGNLPVEDLSKARETLEAFIAYKARLTAGQRDLGRYDSLGDVWSVIEPFVRENAATSGKDANRREREAARAESDILLERDGWVVAIPKTERASRWWGRGTRWCTAAETDNRFAAYAEDGPLVVLVRPDGEKFQWHGPSGQFMDSADREANVWTALHDLIQSLDIHDPLRLALEPDAQRREAGHPTAPAEVWEAVMDRFHLPLNETPWESRTRAVCEIAVTYDDTAFRFAPEGILDADLCLAAVRVRPGALRHMPMLLRSRDVCEVAIQADAGVVRHVPSTLLDEAMCEFAIRSNARVAISRLPRNILTDRLLLLAIQFDGTILRCIDEPTREICLTAVRQNGRAILYVPVGLADEEMLLAAVRQTPEALWECTPGQRTPAVLAAVAESSPAIAIGFMKSEDLTREFCLRAVRENGRSLQNVPAALRDREMCEAALASRGEALAHVPPELLTQDLCRNAVEKIGQMIRHVPDHMIDRAMAAAVIRRNGHLLCFIPKRLIDRDLCLAAVGRFGQALEAVPRALRDREICEAAVTDDGHAIRHVPVDLWDVRMCALALRSSPGLIARQAIIDHVPASILAEVLAAADGERPLPPPVDDAMRTADAEDDEDTPTVEIHP